jgi:hypothetical protein
MATGDNKYFILTQSDIEGKGLPTSQFKPILPSPRHLSGIEVETDNSFRFILNHSKAIVANSYLILYPKPEVVAVIAKDPEMVATFFEALNAITEKVMVDEGRVYGGGMHKLEPRELANVPAPEILRSIETIK